VCADKRLYRRLSSLNSAHDDVVCNLRAPRPRRRVSPIPCSPARWPNLPIGGACAIKRGSSRRGLFATTLGLEDGVARSRRGIASRGEGAPPKRARA
jgi:hypothetical protein